MLKKQKRQRMKKITQQEMHHWTTQETRMKSEKKNY